MSNFGRYRESTMPGPGSTPFQIGSKKEIRVRDGKVLKETAITASASAGYSSSERCWDHNNGRPPYKTGKGLMIVKRERSVQVESLGRVFLGYSLAHSASNGPVEIWYEGGVTDPFLPTSVSNGGGSILQEASGIGDQTTSTPTLLADLSSLGNRAYNKLRPKVEKAGLLQSLIELREAPRMLKTTAQGFLSSYTGMLRALGKDYAIGTPSRRVNAAAANAMYRRFSKDESARKQLGDQYLNFQFGWKPFVKDVVNVCDVAVNGDKYIADGIARNDKWVQRRFAEDEISSEELVYSRTDSTCVDPAVLNESLGLGAKCSYTITLEHYERVWYEGSFKVYRREFDKRIKMHPGLRKVRQYATLMGLNVSPTVLWKVTPWTWLIDWFSDVGGAIQRSEDLLTQSVCSQYFYIMRHKKRRYRCRLVYTDLRGKVVDLSWYVGATIKQRGHGSSPFSFNLSPGGLSETQLSILAALGLSKLAP